MKSIILVLLFFVGYNQFLLANDSLFVTTFYLQLGEFKTKNKDLNGRRGSTLTRDIHQQIRLRYNLNANSFHSEKYNHYIKSTKFHKLGEPSSATVNNSERKLKKKVDYQIVNELIELAELDNAEEFWPISESSPPEKQYALNYYYLSLITNKNDTIRFEKMIRRNGEITPWRINFGERYVNSNKIDKIFIGLVKQNLIGIRRLKKTL